MSLCRQYARLSDRQLQAILRRAVLTQRDQQERREAQRVLADRAVRRRASV